MIEYGPVRLSLLGSRTTAHCQDIKTGDPVCWQFLQLEMIVIGMININSSQERSLTHYPIDDRVNGLTEEQTQLRETVFNFCQKVEMLLKLDH